MRFADRVEAGRVLAEHLSSYRGALGVVLGLPRGGVPVAYEVARALDLPLDVLVVRKLGLPGHEELAIGAIASGGVVVYNEPIVRALAIPDSVLRRVVAREQRELDRRERAYRGERPPRSLAHATVILVDDGLATGATMRAAVRAVRQRGPAKVVVAAPVGAAESCGDLAAEADEVVCAATPEPFHAVGLWYDAFTQTSDDEVRDLLERADRERRRLVA